MVGVAMMVGSVSEGKRKRKSAGRKVNRGDIFPGGFVMLSCGALLPDFC